jgi:hypothetical protein
MIYYNLLQNSKLIIPNLFNLLMLLFTVTVFETSVVLRMIYRPVLLNGSKHGIPNLN